MVPVPPLTPAKYTNLIILLQVGWRPLVMALLDTPDTWWTRKCNFTKEFMRYPNIKQKKIC